MYMDSIRYLSYSFLDHTKYIEYRATLAEQMKIEGYKTAAKTTFYKSIEFNSTLIALFGIVWIWGITGILFSIPVINYLPRDTSRL